MDVHHGKSHGDVANNTRQEPWFGTIKWSCEKYEPQMGSNASDVARKNCGFFWGGSPKWGGLVIYPYEQSHHGSQNDAEIGTATDMATGFFSL